MSYKGQSPKPKNDMNKKCIQCKSPNPEGWFYCKACGKQTSEKKFTTNLYMMSEIGKRTDIEFNSTTMGEDIKQRNKKYA